MLRHFYNRPQQCARFLYSKGGIEKDKRLFIDREVKRLANHAAVQRVRSLVQLQTLARAEPHRRAMLSYCTEASSINHWPARPHRPLQTIDKKGSIARAVMVWPE